MKIEFNDVSFKYDKKSKEALKNINVDISKNEIVFIMGHTGSGKSTLVQHINGLLRCNEGYVRIKNDENEFVLDSKKEIKNINDLRKNIGLLFQFSEYQLFETSVIKDVMFGPYNFYKDKEIAKQMAVEALNSLGVSEDYYEKSPFELSGGEKRKIAMAGVLAYNPNVLIMDEPTSSLDPLASKEMMKLIAKLKEEGKTIIVISHDSDLCYEYADRVIIMADGYIVRDSEVNEAFKDLDILKSAGLIEPFVCKMKRVLNIKDNKIRNIEQLKGVIKHE